MIKIRLARYGHVNDPFYRVVAIDERKKTTGEALEILGYWNPREQNKSLKVKEINAWVKKGAQISPAIKKLMEK